MSRESVQVDGDIDLHVPGELRDLPVGSLPHVDEAVKAGRKTLPHGIRPIRPERETDDLESSTVMQLEQAGRQLRGGMIVIVRGEVADSYLVVPGLPSDGFKGAGECGAVLRANRGGATLQGRIIVHEDYRMRLHGPPTVRHCGRYPFHLRLQSAPLASPPLHMQLRASAAI